MAAYAATLDCPGKPDNDDKGASPRMTALLGPIIKTTGVSFKASFARLSANRVYMSYL